VAFVEPELYKHFYAIAKEQFGNNLTNKWEDYSLMIDKNIFDKIKEFEPINNCLNKNSKGFRTSKNGKDTGIFQKIADDGEEDIINNNVNNTEYQNNMDSQNSMQIPKDNRIKINIIPNMMNEN